MGKDFRFNIKLNPDNAEHMQVARILDGLGRGAKRQLIVDAILAYTASDGKENMNIDAMRETIRTMIDEELNSRDKLNVDGKQEITEGIRNTTEQIKPGKQDSKKPQKIDSAAASKNTGSEMMDDIMKSFKSFMK